MVILDMAAELAGSDLKVFTIDTGRLPAETEQLLSKVRSRYGVEIEVISPEDSEVDEMVSLHGQNLFRDSVSKRRACCEIRKVRPLKRKLRELDAWVVGLRSGQSDTRIAVAKAAPDEQHAGVYKLCPLADWTDEQVWSYIRRHDLPYHKLYDQGYTSIGCAPCTRATSDGEHSRAGRWWWETGTPKECGIHLSATTGIGRELDVLLDEVLVRAG
jgi:thioredoxin-dependent adenylylsulfate APS reductase